MLNAKAARKNSKPSQKNSKAANFSWMPWNFYKKRGGFGAIWASLGKNGEIYECNMEFLLYKRNFQRAENCVFAGKVAVGDFCAILAC